MPEVRAVVFDVGEVLFHWDMRALFAKLIADEAQLDHFMANVLTHGFHYRHDAGEELHELVAELTGRHPDHAEAIHAYAHRFNETITGPVAGTHELVERLAARNVPIFGLTNFSKAFWAGFVPTAPIFDHFADIVVSGEEKVAKPDPAIYRLAQQRFNFAPHELFFADDRAENVAAAQVAGWRAHLFTHAAGLEAELAAAGLI